ncbi:VanW family protein [Nocardioides sp. YIM 152588]|uniref:VanW family protein n=1 Tax=Nocardioides sp. YIM 152588 TaxID=3158259 RepID=UPI0032E4D64F
MTFWDQDGEGSGRERPGGRLVIVLLLVLVLLAGGLYAGAHAIAGDKVPQGASISGVDVGGMERDAAIAELEDAFEARGDEAIELSVSRGGIGPGDRTASVTPAEIGLAVDYEASVDAAGAGESWSPQRQWDYFTGGGSTEAVVAVDEELLDETLGELSEGLGIPPRDGAIRFTREGVKVIDPVPGDAVDTDAAEDAIVAAYLDERDQVELEVTAAQPEIGDAEVQRALDEFANPAMSGPVTLVFGDSEVKLRPAQYASALSMANEDGALVPEVDQKQLTRLVKSATTSGEPVDASVRLVDGKPKVVPAKPGVEFDPDTVTDVFLGLVAAPEGERSGKVEADVVEAEFTTRDARALKIKRKVSEFTTYYPHAEYRNVNIGRAAELVDGTVLKPGETFSLNGTVGERTAENGFTVGYIISNGILKKDYGGGVSQMATTLFNAMFFAGLEDVEHKPHSFYIDRYPVGREATVAWPTVDLRFRNDTDYGVLIHSTVKPSTYSSQGVVTVQMYSTKVWDIESTTSDRYAYVEPATRTLTTADCEPFTGYSGFQIDVKRTFRKAGESTVDHTENFHTVYTPADTVRCEQPEPEKPKKRDQDRGQD